MTSTAKNLDNLDKRSVEDLIKEAEKKLQNNSLTDKEKYILSYKMSSLEEINQ